MTNEHNFKVGDRVRFVGDYDHYVERILEKDEEYAVTYVDSAGNCDLSVPCTAYSVSGEDLELGEPYDRRTAFLTRLQSLLKEFDARIYDEDCYRLYIDFDIHIDKKGCLDYQRIVYSDTSGEITADNIMDFDKEGV